MRSISRNFYKTRMIIGIRLLDMIKSVYFKQRLDHPKSWKQQSSTIFRQVMKKAMSKEFDFFLDGKFIDAKLQRQLKLIDSALFPENLQIRDTIAFDYMNEGASSTLTCKVVSREFGANTHVSRRDFIFWHIWFFSRLKTGTFGRCPWLPQHRFMQRYESPVGTKTILTSEEF